MNFTGNCQLNHLPLADEINVQILSVMKIYSPTLLVAFCAVNILATILSVSGNVLVFSTVVSFSELHITSNIGLASFALANFFEGISIHGISTAASVIAFQDGCPFLDSTRVFINFLAAVSVYSPLLNLTLVTIERYIDVIHPLRYYVILPPQRMAKVIAAVWIASLFLSIPRLVHHSLELPRTTMTLTFPLTIVVTFYCNLKIYRSSRRHRQIVVTQVEAIRQIADLNRQRFRGAKTRFFVFVTPLICFAPALVIRFLLKGSSKASNLTSLTLERPWAAALFGMYSCVSPFVYFFRSRELRKYSKKLLCRGLNLLSFDFCSQTTKKSNFKRILNWSLCYQERWELRKYSKKLLCRGLNLLSFDFCSQTTKKQLQTYFKLKSTLSRKVRNKLKENNNGF